MRHEQEAASACQHVHSTRSQLSAHVSAARPGESVSKHRPASSQSVTRTQHSTSVVRCDTQLTGQTLPPSGKQRQICSVEVPGIGRAAKVNYVNCIMLRDVTHEDIL